MPADWHSVEDVQAWIDLGYASVPAEATTEQSDAIATAYTYYRGYRARADTLLGSPDNVAGGGIGDISISQSNGRYDRMIAQANAYLAEWEAAVAAVGYIEPEVELRTSRSASIRLLHRWN